MRKLTRLEQAMKNIPAMLTGSKRLHAEFNAARAAAARAYLAKNGTHALAFCQDNSVPIRILLRDMMKAGQVWQKD